MLNEQDVYLFPFCPGEVYMFIAYQPSCGVMVLKFVVIAKKIISTGVTRSSQNQTIYCDRSCLLAGWLICSCFSISLQTKGLVSFAMIYFLRASISFCVDIYFIIRDVFVPQVLDYHGIHIINLGWETN